MMRALVVLGLFISSSALAQSGRVALVDTGRLFHKTGIANWATARARLDAEERTFVVVESPDGKNADPHADVSDPTMRTRLTDLDRDLMRIKAWSAHEREVLEPIRADVMHALDTYAQGHDIAIVLDRDKLGEAVLVVIADADITDAFIKDYNAKTKRKSGRK